MKSAYELAMERLEESSPQAKISDEQKAEIAAIDEKFRAKMAEREVFLADLLVKARMEGDYHEMKQLETQKAREIASLKADCEAAKDKVRASA
ncbi:hypothetical protein VSU19_22860 [Verrucomicrobiales bacterium BCK34]|nr:hypothetical protein [Verrucomicrobiales bacterium BCK34]